VSEAERSESDRRRRRCQYAAVVGPCCPHEVPAGSRCPSCAWSANPAMSGRSRTTMRTRLGLETWRSCVRCKKRRPGSEMRRMRAAKWPPSQTRFDQEHGG
jgi:hypothetical protein